MSSNSTPFVKGFKYRIYPDLEQQIYLNRVFGCCRYIYNRLIADSAAEYKAWKEDPYKNAKPQISGFAFTYRVPLWKKEEETAWLAKVPAQVLQAACAQSAAAFQKFFKQGKGYPNFKKKQGRQSASYSNQIYQIRGGKLHLAKCKTPIKIKFHRALGEGNITNCTVSRTPSGKYYASFICEYTPNRISGDGIIGIDVGLSTLGTCSNGQLIENSRYYVKSQQTLARRQKALSRKVKGSSNRNKARLKVARLHEHITNQRKVYLHAVTSSLIRENQAIGVEKLNVAGMIKNRKLAKHIADASWGEFRRQLMYKAAETKKCCIVLADPFFPSTQLCSVCHTRPKQKLQLHERSWTCETCGSVHQRDKNASHNLELLARITLTEHGTEFCAGKTILTENRKALLDMINSTPISKRCQPMESSCAVRHLSEVGSVSSMH